MSQPTGTFARFLSELRRRRVLRVIIPYLAGCWILLQLGSIMFPVLGAKNTAFWVLVGVLGTLLPLVTAIAWVYQLTPHGLVRTPPFVERRVLNNIPPTLDRRASLKRGISHCTSGWSIYAQSGPIEGLEYCVANPIVIGRAIECDLTVLRSYISRNHAELRVEDGVLWVRDLGSSNGTLVNGVRINGLHALSHGDELRFKDVAFQVREDRSQFKSDALLNQTMFIDKPEVG